jgi:hypothetical protein
MAKIMSLTKATPVAGLASIIIQSDVATRLGHPASTAAFSLAVVTEISTLILNAWTTFAIVYKVLPVIRDYKRHQSSTDNDTQIWRSGSAILVFLGNGTLHTLVGVIQLTLFVKVWATNGIYDTSLSATQNILDVLWVVQSV